MCMVVEDPVTLLSTRHQQARKPYTCQECQRTIEAGEVYQYEAYVYEGDFESHRTCAHCVEARRWIYTICKGFYYSMILEDLAEHVYEPPVRSSKLVRLARYSQRKWRRNDGSLVPPEDVVAWCDAAIAAVPEEARGGSLR